LKDSSPSYDSITTSHSQIKEEEEPLQHQLLNERSDFQHQLHSKQSDFRTNQQSFKHKTNPLGLNTTLKNFQNHQQQQQLHTNIVEQIHMGLSQLQHITNANQQRSSLPNGQTQQQMSPVLIGGQQQQQQNNHHNHSQISHFLPSPSQQQSSSLSQSNSKKRPHSFENLNNFEHLSNFPHQKQQQNYNHSNNLNPLSSLPHNNTHLNNNHQRFSSNHLPTHFPVSSSDLLYISNQTQFNQLKN
jgi:hypothetical protein